MAIKRVTLTNFKSFDEISVNLKNFNVLIGANASGKSNFINVFRFVKDISDHGLDNAIALQGGIEYLRNIKLGSSKNFSIHFECDSDQDYSINIKGKGLFRLSVNSTDYKFEIKFHKRGPGFNIVNEELTRYFELSLLEKEARVLNKIDRKSDLSIKSYGPGYINYLRAGNKLKLSGDPPKDSNMTLKELFPIYNFMPSKLQPKMLLIEHPIIEIPFYVRLFSNIAIYDFDPKLSKKASQIKGKIKLEEDGSNLAVILNNVLKYKSNEEKFINLIRDFLPFIKKVGIDKFADKSLLLNFKEKYFQKKYLPASIISDGTIHIISLIIALYFDKYDYGDIPMLKIIEEPERNIHPYLISKIMDMIKSASVKNQIIATTHNPEVVRYTDIENLLLVGRDDEGFTIIESPQGKKRVQDFLKHDIGIEELYVKNLLDI